MITLHSLKPIKKKVAKKRVGRGSGSGYGGTATAGHKGAQARSGYKKKFGFEGGQMPIQRRLPRFGFVHTRRKEYTIIGFTHLQKIAEEHQTSTITPELLQKFGIGKPGDLYKVLANGSLKMELHITAHQFSSAAREIILSQQGSCTVIA